MLKVTCKSSSRGPHFPTPSPVLLPLHPLPSRGFLGPDLIMLFPNPGRSQRGLQSQKGWQPLHPRTASITLPTTSSKGSHTSCCPRSHPRLPGPLSHLPPRTKWPLQCLLHSGDATGPPVWEREVHQTRSLGAHCPLQTFHPHHCQTQPSSCPPAWILCQGQWSGAAVGVRSMAHLPRPIQGLRCPQAPHLPALSWGRWPVGTIAPARCCRWPRP